MDALNPKPVHVPSLDRLRETSDVVATSFESFRKKITAFGPLDVKQRELCLLGGYTSAGNYGGFVVHCHKAYDAGVTLEEIKHAVLLQFGSNIGIAATVKCLELAEGVYADRAS